MQIEVLDGDWGAVSRAEIKRLLCDVASHIERELREPLVGIIHVMSLPEEEDPIAYHRPPNTTIHKIGLSAKDQSWSQFTYQFAHEFCHVLSGHDRLKDNPNGWFHESLCELASLFVLRRMAKIWKIDPPDEFPSSYSGSLNRYVECKISKWQKAVPTIPFSSWVSKNERELRMDPYIRIKNGVVALMLLPLFEKNRHGWNAVRHLPVSEDPIREYIDAWKIDVRDIDRPFVESVGKTLLG